ncbi:hypothetical protein Bb109J_c1241 [Bdellovibrio bacteriovorus]|nr:hypothetical protein Bb109J_c1241 [Bdellovibrio bacteriovorus]
MAESPLSARQESVTVWLSSNLAHLGVNNEKTTRLSRVMATDPHVTSGEDSVSGI